MLYLIGLGLWDEKDLTQRGLETARACNKIYLENYTSKLGGLDKQKLRELLDKKFTEVGREKVEKKPKFLEEAEKQDIALLVAGDPLAATTHSDLILRAKEKGINVKIVHNASIFSAVGETGLQLYKFGKTLSIPFWEKNFKPKSFYHEIKKNQEQGLHSLLLLDTGDGENWMTANKAIEMLLRIEEQEKENVFTKKTELVVLARLGSPDSLIKFGRAKELIEEDFGEPLHALVVPGKLHEMEEKFLEEYR